MISRLASFLPFLFLLLPACQTVPAQPSLAERQVAVLRANGFQQAGDNWELGLADRLLFATDDSFVVPAQRDVILRLARALADVGVVGAEVDGHTDATGTASYNRTLSLRRAQAVADALAEGGMNPEAIRAQGLGESAPIEGNGTRAGRQENRRVVIIVSPADMAAP